MRMMEKAKTVVGELNLPIRSLESFYTFSKANLLWNWSGSLGDTYSYTGLNRRGKLLL